jgi:tetratricopeptide (TPR) repeat protein
MSSRITKLISIPIISAYLLINAQAAGAACPQHSSFICRLIAWGGWVTPMPSDPNEKEEIRNLKAKKEMVKYLKEGYLNSQIDNYPQSRESFTQGLKLAESAGDLRGQALALEGLGIASIRMGDNQTARAHLIQAKSLYQRLGKQLLVNEMNLYLIKIPKPKVKNLP